MTVHQANRAPAEGQPLFLFRIVAHLRAVTIATYGEGLRDRLELLQHAQIGNVASVQDNIHAAEKLQYARR